MPGFDPNAPPGANGTALPDSSLPLGPEEAPPYDPAQDPILDRLHGLEPLDLNLDLGFERELTLAHLVCLELDAYLSATDRRRSNLNVWRLAWEMMPPCTSNRCETSSDMPSALTRIIGNSHHT